MFKPSTLLVTPPSSSSTGTSTVLVTLPRALGAVSPTAEAVTPATLQHKCICCSFAHAITSAGIRAAQTSAELEGQRRWETTGKRSLKDRKPDPPETALLLSVSQ